MRQPATALRERSFQPASWKRVSSLVKATQNDSAEQLGQSQKQKNILNCFQFVSEV
jgi:hypothetical protein